MPDSTGEKSLETVKLLPVLKSQHARPDKHKGKHITGTNQELRAVLFSDLLHMALSHQTFKFLGHTSTKRDKNSTVCSTTYAQDYSTDKREINYISLKVNAEGCLEYSLFYLNGSPTMLPTLE